MNFTSFASLNCFSKLPAGGSISLSKVLVLGYFSAKYWEYLRGFFSWNIHEVYSVSAMLIRGNCTVLMEVERCFRWWQASRFPSTLSL